MTTFNADLQGKVALVTGASGGIGEATARALASFGATVYLLCRNAEKAEAIRASIIQQTHNSSIHTLLGDLAELAQVRRAAQTFLDSGEDLHILVNNAAVVNATRHTTVDGFEETFAVNHLAPFLLTNMLLPRIKNSAPARIVNVSSMAHHFVRGMQFDDLGFEQNYKTFKVYGQSKLANLLFTSELATRLEGTGVTVNALHPGAVSTGLGAQNYGVIGKIVPLLTRPFFRTPEKGAESSIYLAAAAAIDGVNGKYFYNCKPVEAKPWAQDSTAAKRLWQLSEAMVGLG